MNLYCQVETCEFPLAIVLFWVIIFSIPNAHCFFTVLMIISMPSILGALKVFWIWEFVLTYLWKISFLSWWSSSMLTDRSEMETAVEAVRVTSSTSVPSPSSRATSSLCVHSFERRERSTWHLTRTQHHHHYHAVLQDIMCMTREKNSRIKKKTPKQNKWVFI